MPGSHEITKKGSKGAQRPPQTQQYSPHGVFLVFSRVFQRFYRFFSYFRGVRKTPAARAAHPSGASRKQHFGLKIGLKPCVFALFTFSAPRHALDSD